MWRATVRLAAVIGAILGPTGLAEAQVPVPRGPRRVVSAPRPAPVARTAQPAARGRVAPAPRVYVGGNTNPANVGANSYFMPLPPENGVAPGVAGVSNYQMPTYSAGYYGTYGFPNTYYVPTYQSYAPYAAPGSVVAGTGYPVPSVTYATPGAPVLYQGGATPAANPLYTTAGYLSYTNPTPFYGAPNMTSVNMPGYITYGQNSHAALTPPGYYGNYVVTPGATITSPGITTP